MPRQPLRMDSDFWPLVARAALIAVCGVATAIAPGVGAEKAIAPALLLLLVAAIGTVPVPPAVPAWLQPVTETLAAAVVVGALGATGVLFLPYLLVPLAAAGLAAGLGGGLLAAGTASFVLLLTALVPPVSGRPTAISGSLPGWVPIFVAVALVAAWIRRVAITQRSATETAYADAHRLLSELHVVARQLSLGLDPPTLAAALVDELAAVAGRRVGEATVVVRSGGGRFVPLTGLAPSTSAESVAVEAFLAAEPAARARDGRTVAALPVLMGERVVAVVVLDGGEQLDGDALRACERVIADAGPRLASALLFDDVRRLATVDERMRLAREIHDGIAQDMASVGYQIDDIARDADPGVAARLGGLRDHLRTLVQDLRLSIFDLRTGVDESVGLAGTLGEYVQRVGAQAGLAVHVSAEESGHRLPVATEVELLRIVQEAVTNVRRHAGAQNLWLAVAVDPPRARIRVSDDGRGLGPGRPDSIGMVGMRERATRIGGVMSVGLRPGGGTVVEIAVDPQPVPAALAAAAPVSTGRRVLGRQAVRIGHHESTSTPHAVTIGAVASGTIGGGRPSTAAAEGGPR